MKLNENYVCVLCIIEETNFYFLSEDFGTNWNEQSLNLALFEGLSELDQIEYTPPASPGEKKIPTTASTTKNVAKRPQTLALPQNEGNAVLPPPVQMGTPEFEQLTSEFQTILESLKQPEQQADIGGIPTSFVSQDVERLFLTSLQIPDLDNSMANDLLNEDVNMTLETPELEIEIELTENELELSANQSSLICNENELLSVGSQGPQGSILFHTDNSEKLNSIDIEANAAERIIDALLEGNLQVAESYIEIDAIENGNDLELILEEAIEDEDEDDNCSITSSSIYSQSSSVSVISETPEEVKPKVVKPERR